MFALTLIPSFLSLFDPLLAGDLSGPGSSWVGWMYSAVPVVLVLAALFAWIVAKRQHERGV